MFNVDLTGEYVTFFVFAVIMVSGAVLMISLDKVVHMVLSMAAVFLGLAGMYVLLEAEFVAFVQVMIYVGAVSVIMIFGIMMTNHSDQQKEPIRPLHEALAAVAAVGLFGMLFYAIRTTTFVEPPAFQQSENQTAAIGEQLFTGYLVPFELVSILLTVAFIGAIALAKKESD